MDSILKWTLALLVLVSIFTRSDCLTYVNDYKHYYISLGEKWDYIDKASIKKAEADSYARTGETIRYRVGFKLRGSSDFTYPYILIQEMDRNTISMKELEALFKNDELATGFLNKYSNYQAILDNFSLNKPIPDKERGIIYIALKMGIENSGDIVGLTGMVFGKDSITGIYCYATASAYERYYKDFVKIIESCTFEPDYEYSGITQVFDESGFARKSGWLHGSINKAGVGLISGALFGIVFLVFRWISWMLKKKPKPHYYGEIDYEKISHEELKRRLMAISDINEANNLGVTAIMIASATTHDAEKIKLLLDKGADANQTSNDGMTAFMFACSLNENLEIVKLVGSCMQNIDQKNISGRTALSFAAECNNNTEVVAYLINEGADVNSKDNDQRTPLIWACASGECEDNVLLLIERGAIINSKDNTGYTAYKHIKRNGKLKHSRMREILKEKTGA